MVKVNTKLHKRKKIEQLGIKNIHKTTRSILQTKEISKIKNRDKESLGTLNISQNIYVWYITIICTNGVFLTLFLGMNIFCTREKMMER